MIMNNMLELLGNTPLVRLGSVSAGCVGEVVVKLENRNPSGSVKDRAAWAMLMAAEAEGRITPQTLLVEPTSGNTGIALAFVCAVRKWRLALVMPESMSTERRALLRGLGAELVLTPAAEGMNGAVKEAERMVAANPGALLVGQFVNPANPEIHRRTTAEEIWRDTEGRVDAFVAGIGTGGTVSGVGSRLKELFPAVRIVGVEPAESPLLTEGRSGPHLIQGIGANFVPGNYDPAAVDEVLAVPGLEAMDMARRLMREEGILCGISSGANVAAAVRVASRPDMAGKRVVTIICDGAERYISTDLFQRA